MNRNALKDISAIPSNTIRISDIPKLIYSAILDSITSYVVLPVSKVIYLIKLSKELDNLQENKILETIKISYGTDSYADVIKTGNQIWLYIRFYSETGQVTIPQNTKLFKLKDEYILGIKFNKYTPLVFPVYEREISNDMFLFSIVSGYVQPNTQFSFAGNTHCGFVRLI